ncbi:hypothetical protein [Ideonella sp. A 288]|uniref:hypothetical protein n=1 Tax=Ideonella sp. A 288 TaxID=1962181 RepID=UPI000B4B2102|nr:hypothetical protein [Ideonella sp. A 288]
MSGPSNTREALIAEAIGDLGTMMRDMAALAPLLEDSREALLQAKDELRESLADFQNRVLAISDNAKTQTVKYMAVKADEMTRRSIDQQGRAMADAARVALGAEVGAMLQCWQATLQALIDQQRTRRWEAWLTHVAAAAVASAATLGLLTFLGHG